MGVALGLVVAAVRRRLPLAAGALRALALVAATALAGSGCGGQPPAIGHAAPDVPRPAAAPAAPASPAAFLEIPTVLGVEREIDVLAGRDGIVVEIAREQGALVEKGALLGRLDDRDIAAEIERARAALLVAENNVKYNEAELKARQAAFRRARELSELGLLSQADYERAEFEAQGAGYDLESWRANVVRSRAEIRKLEVDLEKTRITAAFPGVVARRYVREGQGVRKDDRCFRLAQLAPLQARFLVPETALPRPAVGALVQLRTASGGERGFPAQVRRVSPVVDAASGSIEVLAELTGPGLEDLRPGMAVRVLWGAEKRD